jgi:hypothetical protein
MSNLSQVNDARTPKRPFLAASGNLHHPAPFLRLCRQQGEPSQILRFQLTALGCDQSASLKRKTGPRAG